MADEIRNEEGWTVIGNWTKRDLLNFLEDNLSRDTAPGWVPCSFYNDSDFVFFASGGDWVIDARSPLMQRDGTEVDQDDFPLIWTINGEDVDDPYYGGEVSFIQNNVLHIQCDVLGGEPLTMMIHIASTVE
jgi:hypothetical protein